MTNIFDYIHLFRTEHQFYCYVAYSNAIVVLDEDTWKSLDSLKSNCSGTNDDIHRLPPVVSELLEEADVSSSESPQLIHSPWKREELENQLLTNLTQLTLVVTETCNLECKYCLYGDLYPAFRKNSTQKMPRDVAIQAIDFFLDRCRRDETVAVGFYGGEPLMNFNLIEFCLQYVSHSRLKNLVQFSMTTNATLLSPDKVTVLHDYNVALLVSLDGPKLIHDKNRRTKTGQGSFDRILKNITWIKINYPEYFDNISFNIVTTPDVDIQEVYDFFSENSSLFERNILTHSNIVSYPSSVYDHFDTSKNHLGFRVLEDRYVELAEKGSLEGDKFLRALFERPLVEIHKRAHWNGFPYCLPPNGICLPGTRKVLVNPNGDFQICERVATTETIGGIDSGFNYDKIWSLINEYVNLCSEDCLNCWAIRLCSTCFSDAYDGVLSKSRKEWVCNRIKKAISSDLVLYCRVLEKNPHAFDYMKNLKISV